jgi:hypothetical protein
MLAGVRSFFPLLLALPLLLVFIVYDQRPGRSWQAELAAPIAFSAVVSAIALAGGWSFPAALALWAFMIARSVPAILFIRVRLRLDKGKSVKPWGTYLAHLVAVLVVGTIAWLGWLPWSAVLATVILLARSVWGLSAYRWQSSVKALGFLETGFGLMAVLLVAAGYWFD